MPPAAHLLAASTQAQALSAPIIASLKTKGGMAEKEIARFRHRRKPIKAEVRSDAKVTNSRQKVPLAPFGESELGKVAVWKGGSCCCHPNMNSQTSVKEHRRSQTSLKF